MSALTGEEYMQLLLDRKAAWVAEHPVKASWAATPLLESFVLPGDEKLFTPPGTPRTPAPTKDKTAYPRRMVASFTKKISGIEATIAAHEATQGRGEYADPAAINIPLKGSRARHLESQIIRSVEYINLCQALQHLRTRLNYWQEKAT